tara:strand:- start:984 stop:1331 length:348 start_codon:yes stop_codon:yes gene_type:complete
MNWNYAVAEIANEKNASFKHNQEDGFVEWTNGKPPSEKEIQAKITELKNAEPMRFLREQRNRKLAQTDWRASSDLKLSSKWATYRQALRDLPSTAKPTLDDEGNLQNVTWPKEPT